MATKKRRKTRKTSSTRKAWRFVQKQRRRRARMHPIRRRQETVSIFMALVSVPLLLFIGLPAAVMMGVASGLMGAASKASPPPTTKQYKPLRNVNTGKGDEKFSGWFTHKDALKLKKGHPCNDTCKYSTHDKSTCVCSCGTKNHGIWAWGPSGTTTPKPLPRKRRTTTRRRKSRARA